MISNSTFKNKSCSYSFLFIYHYYYHYFLRWLIRNTSCRSIWYKHRKLALTDKSRISCLLEQQQEQKRGKKHKKTIKRKRKSRANKRNWFRSSDEWLPIMTECARAWERREGKAASIARSSSRNELDEWSYHAPHQLIMSEWGDYLFMSVVLTSLSPALAPSPTTDTPASLCPNNRRHIGVQVQKIMVKLKIGYKKDIQTEGTHTHTQ